jgi:hypothetical protein
MSINTLINLIALLAIFSLFATAAAGSVGRRALCKQECIELARLGEYR